MEKLREINEGNAEIKNVYFGFENLFPTKNKNISDIPKKGKKGKKSKSKSKEKKQNNKNSFNQTYSIKNYNEFDNSNYKVKGSKYIQKPVKIIKTDEEREQEYFEEKNKKKKNSKKKKSKNKSKNKIKEKEVTENEENEIIEVNDNKTKNISKKKVRDEESSEDEDEENSNKKIKKKKKKVVNEKEEEILENEKNNKSKIKKKKKNKTKEEEPKIIKEEQKEKKIKKEKKNKSKEKLEEREANEDENHEEIIIISNIKITKNKKKSNEKKNKNKTPNKRFKKKEEREIIESDNNDNGTQSEKKEKKKKKKSNNKSKEKSKSKSKSKTQKSSNTEEVMENNRTQIKIKKINNKIDEGTDMEPEFNEIKDDAMNFVDKHIQNLSLIFNDNKLKNNKNKSFKTINKNKKNNTNDNFNFDLNDTLYKRPYTAHGYKAKSKTKRQIKTSRPLNEEEKIMAFKEKVLVHDKVLSLFNNNLFQKNLKDEFTQTKKPKKSNSKHYMMPKQKDIIKQNKIKKKEIIYYNDKPEVDPDEIKPNEEDENNIKNKNNNAIKLMTSSKKHFTKSKEALNDIDKILTKKNMDTFINNFMCKNNLNLDSEEEKAQTNYQNNQYPYVDISKIKYYHGGKTYYRPKSTNRQNPVNHNNNKLNNSDINLKRYKNRHIFNPNEIISNPNNKFNFFSQTFTKQPIYGKYYNPPEVEDSFNNNISYIESNKWNGRYKLTKYTYEEKENPNDVYNYDYKYDDLNDDSDNELPSTNFKARTLPKYKKIDIEYKDNKTGKIVGGKIDNKIDNKLFQDNGDFDKAIYHPFLIDDDTVNI